MLLVKTRLKVINDELRIVAAEVIEKGQPVWKKSLDDIPIIEGDAVSIKADGNFEYLEKYANLQDDGSYYLDKSDIIYANRSKEGNIKLYDYVGVALEDISIGKELITKI